MKLLNLVSAKGYEIDDLQQKRVTTKNECFQPIRILTRVPYVVTYDVKWFRFVCFARWLIDFVSGSMDCAIGLWLDWVLLITTVFFHHK